jgi:hypothetical protein
VVECNLAKVEVAGSNPVSRSISSAQSQIISPAAKGNGLQFDDPGRNPLKISGINR